MNDEESDEQNRELGWITFWGLLAAIAAWLFGLSVGVAFMRNQAIHRGYMEHDAKTGVVKWIEPEARAE